MFTEYIPCLLRLQCAHHVLRFARLNLNPPHSPQAKLSHSLAQSVVLSPIADGRSRIRRGLTSTLTKQIGDIMKVPDPKESDIVIPYV